jgi:hypothetical protein
MAGSDFLPDYSARIRRRGGPEEVGKDYEEV